MIKVKLQNPSRLTRSNVKKGDTASLILSRAIYQRLGSLEGNKDISEDYSNEAIPAEFRRLLDVFDDIQFNKSFPEALQRDVPAEFTDLDIYLGSLGVTEEYHYGKDFVNITPWLDAEAQSEYRVLMDESDNTYLTDSNGTEVLVYYTGAN